MSLADVQTALYVQYPDANRDVYDTLFKTLSGLSIDPEVGEGTILEFKRRQGALKLSETAFKMSSGLVDEENLRQTWEELFGEQVDHTLDVGLECVTDDLEELIEKTYAKQGLRWRLDCLNKSLGSLRPGDFGFIFARPETGKTTFLASEATRFLEQSERPVIHFNNEEQGNKVMLRYYQAYFGITTDQLLANPRRYRDEFKERTGGRFKLFDGATISKSEVERVVKHYEPSLVIYDQLPKIKGFQSDRDDLRLGAIFQWARELAKGRHAAIGVSQADGTAEGVRYLTMDHVANAKTAVQAEADWILGIGKIHDDAQQGIRFLNLSKNKLLGDQDSIPELRHGRFEVKIESELARYKDIIKFD